MVKYTQTIPRQKPTIGLSVFDNYVGLVLHQGILSKVLIIAKLRRLANTTQNLSSDFVKRSFI